jgi:hypothetical protein
VEQIVDENVENQARVLLPKINQFNTRDTCTTPFANSGQKLMKKNFKNGEKINLFSFLRAKMASSE